MAATWTPHPSVSEDWHEYVDEVRHASLPVTWAALDCVGAWASDIGERPLVLGTMTARVHALPVVGDEHVVVGLDRGIEDRKTLYGFCPVRRLRQPRAPRPSTCGSRSTPRRSTDSWPSSGAPYPVRVPSLNDPIATTTGAPWWRHAVTYQVYVRSFADSDGDGVGDLPGLTSRLPYLKELGVDAVWITPFYTSPQHDHGYDVADHCDVDPLFGTLADADELIAEAHALGLKVVVDLVPNHTSDEHAWFRAALACPARQPGAGAVPVPRRQRARTAASRRTTGSRSSAVRRGPGSTTDSGTCTCSTPPSPTSTGATPRSGDLFEAVLRFWLDRGVDGFRVDVAHGLVKEESLRDQVLPKGRKAERSAEAPHSMVEREGRDEPMWDQPEVHDIYRRWHRVLAEYDGRPDDGRRGVDPDSGVDGALRP